MANKRLVRKLTTLEKLPPHDDDAEQSVLGSIIQENASIGKALELITPEDFFSPFNRACFKAMMALHKKGEFIDEIAVLNEIKKNQEFSIEKHEAEVFKFREAVPTGATIQGHAKIVKEKSTARILLANYQQAAARLLFEQDPEEVRESTERLIKEQSTLKPEQGPYLLEVIDAAELYEKNIEETKWIVEGLIPEGTYNMLFGPSKSGKSFLSKDLALSIIEGKKAFGNFETYKSKVLYLSFEDSIKRIHRRLHQSLYNKPRPGFLITTKCPRLDRMGFEYIRDTVLHHEVKLCIIDTFNRIKPIRKKNGDMIEEDTELSERFQDLTEKTGLAVTVVHHSNKRGFTGDMDFLTSISGTEAIAAGLHNAYGLKPDPDKKNEAVLYIKGKDVEPESYRMIFDQFTWSWLCQGPEKEVKTTLERKDVLLALQKFGGSARPNDIAKRIGKTPKNVSYLLDKLIEESYVKMVGYGKYELTRFALEDLGVREPGEEG